MELFVRKEDWEWLVEMKAEARTRSIVVSTFPQYNPETEEEIAILAFAEKGGE